MKSTKEQKTKIELKKKHSKRSFFDFLWFLNSSGDDDAMGNGGNGKYK